MADVVINTVVKAPDTASLQAIKKELKEMQNLALNGDGVAAKRVADLKEQLEDLKDTTTTLRGSGVEKLTSSFALLKDGFANADPGKIGIAFKGLGAAMSAIPIFLFIEGFKLLVENFDKAKDVFKTIFGLFSEGEKNVKALTLQYEKLKAANELAINSLSNEIKILEAQGVSTDKILAKKKEMNALKIKELKLDIELQKARIQEIVDNDNLTESYYRKSISVLRALGQDEKANDLEKMIMKEKIDRAKEFTDKIKADTIALTNIITDQKVEEIKNEKQSANESKKIAEDKNKRLIELEKQLSEARIAGAQINKDNNKLVLDDIEKEKQAKINAQMAVDQAEYDSMVKKQEAEKKARADKEKARQEDIAAVKYGLDVEAASIQTIQGLSDTLFAIKSANTKSGSAEEEANAKKQFQLNKGLQLAAAAMNGAQAVTAILSVPDFTFGVLSAIRIAAAIATTAGTIAKISATQFKTNGTGGGGGGVSAPSGGGGVRNIPAPNQPTPQQPQQSTQFNEDGTKKGGATKVFVLQKDIKDSIGAVARVDEQSRF